MFNVNRVTLLGNVTHDPDVHPAASGHDVVTMGLATNFRTKQEDGNWQNTPDFHNLVCFRGLADFSQKRIKKGMPLYIEGRLHTSRFQTKEGADASKTEVVVNRIVLLSSDKKGSTEEVVAAEETEEIAA